VFGTLRPGWGAVRQHLLRLGKFRAALLRPEVVEGKRVYAGWGWDWWSGVTESGQRTTVRTWHYADPDAHHAYCSIAWAEMWQAVGRARAILPDGIPVYVYSTENLAPPSDGCDGYHGLPLLDAARFAPLTDGERRVLVALGTVRRTPTELAAALGISRKTVHKHLAALKAAGRARPVGGKWGYIVQ
jgi:hypothetical protein